MSAPVETLLLQAQLLLLEADEANHSGDYGTFALQAQARECLAEAIDRLATAAVRAVERIEKLEQLAQKEVMRKARG